METELILIPSRMMDGNKKQDRNERELLRISAYARRMTGLDQIEDDTVTVQGDDKSLKIFKAFSEDIKRIGTLGFTEEDKKKIAFVTTEVWKKLIKDKNNPRIRISNAPEALEFGLIGADPEFAIYGKEGRMIRASSILSYDGDLGVDGGGLLGELRPKPALTHDELIKNIQGIFKRDQYRRVIENYLFKSGCYLSSSEGSGVAVGGHIHLGTPKKLSTLSVDNKRALFIITCKILDELVALPALLFDGFSNSANRRKTGYGNFGGHREVDEGKEKRVEYRTLSGVWLAHPRVAKAILGVTKLITEEILLRLKENKFDLGYVINSDKYYRFFSTDYNGWAEVPICKDLQCTQSTKAVVDLLMCGGDVDIKKWFNILNKFHLFKKYEEEVLLFKELTKLKPEEIVPKDAILQEAWIEDKPFII